MFVICLLNYSVYTVQPNKSNDYHVIYVRKLAIMYDSIYLQ